MLSATQGFLSQNSAYLFVFDDLAYHLQLQVRRHGNINHFDAGIVKHFSVVPINTRDSMTLGDCLGVGHTLCRRCYQGAINVPSSAAGLTANNITYCLAGDTIGYWNFFPAEEGWGRVPGMGIGVVLESNSEEIQVGERVWGCFPFASHLKVK